jgi:hydrogenase nickel incorporation protein HypB
MCTYCGCGQATVEGDFHTHPHTHDHDHDHGHDHGHGHDHSHDHGHSHDHSHSHDPEKPAGDLGAVHVAGMDPARIIQIEEDILGENNRHADANRRFYGERRIFTLNLVSSPGSGKTTLLVKTIEDCQERFPICVIEGDQQTSMDAERIRATGVPATQVNTGKACHLDAHMVGHAMEHLKVSDSGVLFVENVGNLVCPAAFDLGEAHKVVILSVTEGEDKPIKYPDMFHAADMMIINKIDLLPYVSFDMDQCIAYARRVNPRLSVLKLSATSGEGMDTWYDWIAGGYAVARAGAQS